MFAAMQATSLPTYSLPYQTWLEFQLVPTIIKKIAYLLRKKKTIFSISYYANEIFVDSWENNNTWCVLPNWIEKIYANKASVFDSERKT